MSGGMKRLVVLISGRGSNMQALLEAKLPVKISAVISNEPGAQGLEIARSFGVNVHVVHHRDFADRAVFDHALAEAIAQYDPHLVVLAGFMRILTADFLARFANKVINVHPSLLPAYQG